MQCNIQRRGRVARIITGVLTLAAGVVLMVMAALGSLTGWWPWVVGPLAVGAGGFQIFEGAVGWCVTRAMGFRTPM